MCALRLKEAGKGAHRMIGRPKRPATRDEGQRVIVTRSLRDAGDHWIWQGSKDRKGYGNVWFGQKWWRAQRLAYWAFHGSLDKALTTDHLCRVHACVNPEHLRQITNRENVLIGVGITALNAKKRRCQNGHDLIPPNVYIDPHGWRYCKPCRRSRKKKYREARAAR